MKNGKVEGKEEWDENRQCCQFIETEAEAEAEIDGHCRLQAVVCVVVGIYLSLACRISHRRMKHHTMTMAKSHHTYFVATLSIASPA